MQTSSIKDQSSNIRTEFDLEERTALFGESIIAFCKSLKVDHISRPLISQLIRSATSIGANYSEANNSSSRKDFRNKVYIAKKESQETKHWLRMLRSYYAEHSEKLDLFTNEVHEITLILQTIANKVEESF